MEEVTIVGTHAGHAMGKEGMKSVQIESSRQLILSKVQADNLGANVKLILDNQLVRPAEQRSLGWLVGTAIC